MQLSVAVPLVFGIADVFGFAFLEDAVFIRIVAGSVAGFVLAGFGYFFADVAVAPECIYRTVMAGVQNTIGITIGKITQHNRVTGPGYF